MLQLEWKGKIKYLVPIFISILALMLFPKASSFGSSSRYNVENIDYDNYAYKDLTGLHSPYLIEGGDSYAVNVPIGINYDGNFLEDLEAGTLNKDFFESLGDDYGEDLEEQFLTGEGWGSVLYPIFSDETVGINQDIEDESGFKDFVGDLLSFAVITDKVWDREGAMAATSEIYDARETSKRLLEQAKGVVNGTFSWDYRNTNNRGDFLRYRVGEYIYRRTFYSTDLMYDAIHLEMREKKAIIKPVYDMEDARAYLRVNEGYFVLEVPLNLVISLDGQVQEYSMNYVALWAFKTPSERDVWNLWTSADDFTLNMIAQDYIRDIKRVGGD